MTMVTDSDADARWTDHRSIRPVNVDAVLGTEFSTGSCSASRSSLARASRGSSQNHRCCRYTRLDNRSHQHACQMDLNLSIASTSAAEWSLDQLVRNAALHSTSYIRELAYDQTRVPAQPETYCVANHAVSPRKVTGNPQAALSAIGQKLDNMQPPSPGRGQPRYSFLPGQPLTS